MSDVVSQIEAVIATISQRVTHTPVCVRYDAKRDAQGKRAECVCDRSGRVRSAIARTVERMVTAAVLCSSNAQVVVYAEQWAAAFRATQEQETQK